MRNVPGPLRVVLLSLFAWLASAAAARAADAVFVVTQPLTHQVSAAGSDTIRVFVSAEKDVTDPRVDVVQARTPEGRILPADLVTATAPPATIGPAGTWFTVTLADVTALQLPGDYPVTLRLAGTVGTDVRSQLATLTLKVPAPALDATALQNARLRAWRSAPWGAATLEHETLLTETNGKSNVYALALEPEGVRVSGTSEEVPGARVKVVGADGQPARRDALKAGASRRISISVTGLSTAGTMATALRMSSPSLAQTQRVPFTIEVADAWPWPVAVIAIGVLVGARVRRVSQVERPREQVRLRRALIASHAARWRERTRDPQQVQLLDQVASSLQASDDLLQLGNVTAATTALDQAEKTLGDFQKVWAAAFAKVQEQYDAASRRAAALEDGIDDEDPAQVQQLAHVRASLTLARSALKASDLPSAEDHLVSAVGVIGILEAARQKAGRGLESARALPALVIGIVQPPAARIAGQVLSFTASGENGLTFAAGDEFSWTFGDGSDGVVTTTSSVQHRFEGQGTFTLAVTLRRAATELSSAETEVSVLPRPAEQAVAQSARKLRDLDNVLVVVSLVLAILAGVGLLYLGKTFGSAAQYLEAFLWGFGIDSGVKTVADVLKKV